MKKGDTITIFEDPLTEKKREGTARLVKHLDTDRHPFNGRSVERWMVRFQASGDFESVRPDGFEHETYERAILAPK